MTLPVLFTSDKKRLREHFLKDPVLFAYHLGDLDDFFFRHCQWAVTYGYMPRVEECLLTYFGGDTPAVLAFGVTDSFPHLLADMLDLLPERFHCHFFAPYRDLLRNRFTEQPLGTYLKMRLATYRPPQPQGDTQHIRRLTSDDAAELTALYTDAYPSNYFHPRMLQTGKYFGYIEDGHIVAAVGVHVYSTEFKVAALGNVATHPQARRRGLATGLLAVLIEELLAEDCLTCLNVAADNEAAITCYERLGFEVTHRYEEALFLRSSEPL